MVSPTTATAKSSLDERHLANLYRRIHHLETELFELKKTLFICLFVISTIATLLFLGSIFSYVMASFFSVVFTEWLPSLLRTAKTILFDFSPLMTLARIIFTSLYFFFMWYKRRPSDTNVLTIILCFVVVVFNLIVLVLYIFLNHFRVVFFVCMLIVMSKHYQIPMPTKDDVALLVHNLRNAPLQRRASVRR